MKKLLHPQQIVISPNFTWLATCNDIMILDSLATGFTAGFSKATK